MVAQRLQDTARFAQTFPYASGVSKWTKPWPRRSRRRQPSFSVTAWVNGAASPIRPARESVDLWYVSSELSGAALEAGLRDRVKRLANFQHPSVNHVHSVDRVNNGATIAVISESAIGVRLADLLASAEKHHLPLDISAALCVIRQYLPAIAALYDHDHEMGHGAFGARTPGHHAGRPGDRGRPRDGRHARAAALLARALLEGSPRRAAALGWSSAFRSPRRRRAGRPRRAVADSRPGPDRRRLPGEGAGTGRIGLGHLGGRRPSAAAGRPASLAVSRAADRSPQRVHVRRAGGRRIRADAVIDRLRRRPREPGTFPRAASGAGRSDRAGSRAGVRPLREAGAVHFGRAAARARPSSRRSVNARGVASCRARAACRGAAPGSRAAGRPAASRRGGDASRRRDTSCRGAARRGAASRHLAAASGIYAAPGVHDAAGLCPAAGIHADEGRSRGAGAVRSRGEDRPVAVSRGEIGDVALRSDSPHGFLGRLRFRAGSQ